MELQWPLILFTTLVAWSAGVFGCQGVLALAGAGKKSQQLLTVLSCVLLAASGVAVFFHLQHWERIFNGFGHLTSGITQELIAIVVFVGRRRHRAEVDGVGCHRDFGGAGRGVRAFVHDGGAPGVE